MGCCVLGLKQKNIRDLLLGAVLLASGIRLLKSVLFIYDDEISLYVINLGFAAHAATAVFLWLYVRSLQSPWLSRNHLLHLLPSAAIILFSGLLTLEDFWYRGGYLILIYYSVFYYALSAFEFIRRLKAIPTVNGEKSADYQWMIILFLAVGVFIAGYFVNYNLRVIKYELAPLPYAVAVFPLGYLLWRHYRQKIIKQNPRYENARLSVEKMVELTGQLNKVLEYQKPWLDPRLTVSGLAILLKIPSHTLSQMLNVHLNCSFSDLINGYRVQHACRLLENPEFASLTIASIAYDAGFNSLSVFNKVFKDTRGITPKQYRKNVLPD
jgi:AraC-like DNA-binding protein